MEIVKNFGEDNTITIKPIGRLDVSTSDDFCTDVLSSISDMSNVFLDLSEVPYISSAGLKAILDIAKNVEIKNGTLRIVNEKRNIFDLFRMTGFDKILNIG